MSNVSLGKWQQWKSIQNVNPILIIYGLLPHENQMCVMNAVLKRAPDSTIPIKSKERLIIQCGFRRFIVNPVYSQHTSSDRHKVIKQFFFLNIEFVRFSIQNQTISDLILKFMKYFSRCSMNDSLDQKKRLLLVSMHQFSSHHRQFCVSKKIQIRHCV